MSKTIKWIALAAALGALVAGMAGYVSSGFKSDDLTLNAEGAPVVDVEEALSYEGWSLGKVKFEEGTANVISYSGIRCQFTVDPELVESYEKQGYLVEYGLIYGVGTENSGAENEAFYNSPSTLEVKNEDGKLVSKTGYGTVALVYSTDENAELAEGCIVEKENSPYVWMAANMDFGGDILIDGGDNQALDNKTYVASAFIRLTSSSGQTITEYARAREVLKIVPLELGTYE